MDQKKDRAAQYVRRNRARRSWRNVVIVLACVVVFCTTYALILPAITMERECGLEEHTHSENCYTQQTSIVQTSMTCEFSPHVHTETCAEACGYADFAVHCHNDLCYAAGELICQMPEVLVHTHNDSCYQPVHTHGESCYNTVLGALTCEVPVSEGHTHAEECYCEIPVCGQEETESHTHVPECYERQLICTQEEFDGHEHDESCFVQQSVLICTEDAETLELVCTRPVIALHTHEDACFQVVENAGVEERILICEQQEVLVHTHTEECLTRTEVAVDPTVLTCQLAEDENHTHTDRCYGVWELCCGKEEHTHTDACKPVEETESTEETEKTEESTGTKEEVMLYVSRPIEQSKPKTPIDGTNLTWEVLKNTITNEHYLIIDGEGAIPNYSTNNSPWSYLASGPVVYVELGDNVTKIGTNAFYRLHIGSIEWGGVTEIGSAAFGYGYGPTILSIPGTVTTIGESAFTHHDGVKEFILNEGTTTIGNYALRAASGKLYIPSTVSKIGLDPSYYVNYYEVSDENQFYCDVDGVLFSKDKKVLVHYPSARADAEYVIPEGTEELSGSFQWSRTKRFVFPSSLKSNPGDIFRYSAVEEVYVKDGGKLSTWMLFYNTEGNFQSIRFPENTDLVITDPFHGGSFDKVTSITIPNGTRTLNNFAANEDAWLIFPALEHVKYDAVNSQITSAKRILGSTMGYDLIVGKNVDVLPREFKALSQVAGAIKFEHKNTITVAEGAFESTIDQLSGMVYIDSQGLAYICDPETLTAAVVYCQPGLTSITVPETVTPDDGNTYVVKTVKKNALKRAEDLESITFEAPLALTTVESLSLANCPSLISVAVGEQVETTVEGATALFAGLDVGYNVFYNTGLTGASGTGAFDQEMDGAKNSTITADDATKLEVNIAAEGLKWADNGDGTGGYRLLTGQALTVTASVGNTDPEQTKKYRVYFRVTSDEADLSVKPGGSGEFNGWLATYHATDDPYTVYMEFGVPPEGNTSGLPGICSYPNVKSPGGGLTVWGVIIDPNEVEGTIIESDNKVQISWTTQADDFTVTKTPEKTTTLGVVSDGSGGVKPSGNLSWIITLSRISDGSTNAGKDHASGADFEDIFTIPAGIKWRDDVAEAIANGSVIAKGNVLYAADTRIAAISVSGSNLYLKNRSLIQRDGKNVFQWSVVNGYSLAEMNTAAVTMTIYADALCIDATNFNTSTASTFVNEVYATMHYTYRDDVAYSVNTETGEVQNSQLYSSATRKISGGAASFSFDQEIGSIPYFGQDFTCTLRVYNSGALPWVGNEIGETSGYTMRYNLDRIAYVTPENMERMFAEYPQLIVTIGSAELGEWETVTGAYSEDAVLHQGNSDSISKTTGHTLTVTAGDGVYTVVVKDGTTYTASTVAEALQYAGYAVTSDAKYTFMWPVNDPGTVFTLSGGEERIFNIYSTMKNSFQMINTDWPNQYNSANQLKLANYATVNYPKGNVFKDSWKAQYTVRDILVEKNVTRDGVALEGSYAASDGDVLDYQLSMTHYGSGELKDMPMVDDLFGSQYLLVPIEHNPNLSHLETHGDFYILTEGTYQNVVVGIDDEGIYLNAATIEVTSAENGKTIVIDGNTYTFTGLHTRIKWYFPELPSGVYQLRVNYQSLVDLDLTGVEYTIGNIVMLNDRTNDRLYASIWGGGTLVEFDKDIVLEVGETPADDQLAPDKYSSISEGEQVTYRLTVRSTLDTTTVLNGLKMADALPVNLDECLWQKGVNVTDFRVETDGKVSYKNLDDWYIGDSYGGLIDQRQYILWPEKAQITFKEPSTIYLYFTLTYPADTEETPYWEQYTDLIGGNKFTNDFYLYRYSVKVEHELKIPGHVLLQKGVYGTYHYWDDYSVVASNSRLYYNNRDARGRTVAYYVVLYNDGNKRLYLSDLYDQLPEGFKFWKFVSNTGGMGTYTSSAQTVTTLGGQSPLTDFNRSDISYRSAKITVDTSDGLVFSISKGSSTNQLRYDAEREQYYLDRGEAIEFGYLCTVGMSTETEDAATNMIAMPYTDHSESGTAVIMKEELDLFAVESNYFNDLNDGSRILKTDQQMQQDYGLNGAEAWLVSEVTLHRGGIIPGVTKYTDSYRAPGSDATTTYTNQVMHNSIVNWRVRLHNAGTLAMTDYTFTDIMPYPYSFVGNVTYQMFGDANYSGSKISLISIPEHVPADGMVVNIKDAVASNQKRAVTVNGDPVLFGKDNNTFYVSLSLDENGNEVLQIRFCGLHMSILEGGHMDIELSSVNLTGMYTYSVYTNQALLTPVQEFTTVGQGIMVRDDQNQPVAAKNASSVTVSIGFATSSWKDATEVNRPENTTSAADYIVLSDVDSLVEYKLAVSNDTERAMTKLVLIDNLPEIGDHNPFDVNTDRNSEFTVDFAQEPNVTVRIRPDAKSDDAYEPASYTVQYSTGTNFGRPQSNHWKGLQPDPDDPTQWSDVSTGARSIRVIIDSEIPKDAVVEVTFQAKVSGIVQPGQTAVNNFGYHYALENQTVELEAMSPVVGIKTPSIPSLVKKLVDAEGSSTKALEDTEFKFVLYEGTALAGNYPTREALCEALEAAGRQYRELAVTVAAGSNISQELDLVFDGWNWQVDRQYSIVELPTGEQYSFRRFVGTSAKTYTFTYEPSKQQNVVCENILNLWSVKLHKQNPVGESLEGAVFALYSPVAADQIGITGSGAKEQILHNGQTMYLAAIGESNADGLIQWQNLPRSYYYLLEIKAPDGYFMSESGQILYRSGADQGVYELTVVNKAGYELPQTGGAGTIPYMAGGLLLMAAATGLLIYLPKAKRRKEDESF